MNIKTKQAFLEAFARAFSLCVGVTALVLVGTMALALGRISPLHATLVSPAPASVTVTELEYRDAMRRLWADQTGRARFYISQRPSKF
jgi:hypothetical protein